MDMPKQIGPYRIIRLLGTGGMGEVYLAHDDKLDRPRAIKRLVPKDKNAESQRERFRREARITARLEHPSIVRVFDVFDDGEATCIVMEYVPGATLRQRIVDDGPLSVREALRTGLQIADGMAKAHKEGIIHRDLKSENVLLHLDGTAKVTDFGIAKELGAQTLTEQGKVLGTYTAMSPEQIRGEAVKQASDLFSFGILLYEALTGERPFTGRGLEQIVLAITQHQQSPLSTRIPGLPERLSGLVDSLLIKHWSMRPASFRDVIDELKRIEAALDDAAAALKAPPVVTGAMGDDSTEDPESLAENAAEPEHAATPVDPGHAIVRQPVHGSTSQQRAVVKPGGAPRGRVSRRRWLTGIFAGAGVILTAVLTYGFWPRDIDRPKPNPDEIEPVLPVKRLKIAVLMPEVPKDCPHDRDWAATTVRNAMEEPLFRLQGVFVFAVGAITRTEVAEAVADEFLGATITCHPDRLIIELRRQDANGTLLVPRRSFELDISTLGRSETIQFNVIQLYPDFKADADVPPRGQARPEDLEKFQRLSKAYWHSELSLEQVLDELEGIRRRSPRFLDAYILAAELLMHRAGPEDLDKAWQIMDEAKSIDPDWHPVLSRLFTIALARHDIASAEKVLKEIEALDPGAGFTYYLRGLLLEDAQDTHGARDALQTASERHPSWRILYHLANLNIATCDIQGAQDVLATLLTSERDNLSARALKGQLMGRLDPVAAAREYDSLRPPREPAESFNQAINLMTLGRYADAKSIIIQTMEQHGDDLGGIYTLAEVEKLLGEEDNAETHFGWVLSQVPADEHRADIMVARAMVLAHQRQFEAARKAIESALRREDMEIFYSAAAVYAMAGDTDEAARWTERALACGYSKEWFHYPWFEAIRKMPQFRERIGTGTASPAR